MPGITKRTALFTRMPNGKLRRLDFNLVDTDLGAMIEPNSAIAGLGAGAGVVSVDGMTPNDPLQDFAFDDIMIVGEGEILATIGTSGLQSPRLY